jgi:outer membrane protein assembly factor BamB
VPPSSTLRLPHPFDDRPTFVTPRKFALLALAIPVLVGCGSHASGDWPLPNGDAASTRSAAGSAIDLKSAPRLRVAWRFRLSVRPGPSGAFTATPVVAGSTVYLQDMQSNVYAVGLAGGRLRWRHRFDQTNPGPDGVAVGDGRVYGATDTDAFALDAADGRLLWRRPLVTATEQYVDLAPLVDAGRVYFATIGEAAGGAGALYALDAKTGAVRWRIATLKEPWRLPQVAYGGGSWYPPSVVDGTVYWGTANPYPYGGTRRHPNGGAFPGRVLYTDSLLALDAASGVIRWHDQVTPHDVRDYDFTIPPIVAGNTVFGAGKSGRVIAWDRRSHARLWETEVGVHRNDRGPLPVERVAVCPGLLGGVETPMAYADGTLFVPVVNLCMRASRTGYVPLEQVDPTRGRGELVALDATSGRVLWTHRFGSPLFACATAAGGVVFTVTFAGAVVGVDARDGLPVWRRRLRAGVNACPSIAGGRLIVGAGVPLRPGATPEVTAFAVARELR